MERCVLIMYSLPDLKPDEVLVYLRKSRADDPSLTVAEVLSKHEQMLGDWMSVHLSGPVPEENRFREIVSGETISARPEVQKVLRLCEQPRFRALLVVEPQRLSRGDLEDIGYLTKVLRFTHTIVITLQFSFDLEDSRDRESFERELMRGNDYLEYQKRILANGRHLAVSNGWFIGNRAPFGYRRVVVRDGKRNGHTLEPVPDEASIVRQVFEMYASGTGLTEICSWLDAVTVKPGGGTAWLIPDVIRMLDNAHYRGMVRWGYRKNSTRVVDGVVKSSRKRSEDVEFFPGRHPAIVSDELWDAVQRRRGTVPKVKREKTLRNPFAGLLFCSCCGAAMILHTSYGSGKYSYLTYQSVRCQRYRTCQTVPCSLSAVTDAVVGVLEQEIESFEVTVPASNDAAATYQRSVDLLSRRVQELSELELRQWDGYTREGMPREVFERLNRETVAQKEKAEAALQELRAQGPPPQSEDIVVSLRAALDALRDPNASAQAKNDFLKACIEKITYTRASKSDPPEFVVTLKV